MARLPSGTTPFMQRPTQRADILGLGKTPKRLLKVSGKHFGSQKQANIRNRTPAIPSVRTAFRRETEKVRETAPSLLLCQSDGTIYCPYTNEISHVQYFVSRHPIGFE